MTSLDRAILNNRKEEKHIVNGYEIILNTFYKTYQVSHKNIGANIAEFDTLKESINYCERG